ncbi:MAG: hypothetical protein GY762_16410 [Proteobacteria bacterium]|nr:hypothetical protein [Pseudomonadota bacterium]
MSPNEVITVEVALGDGFKVASKIGERSVNVGQPLEEAALKPIHAFFVSFGSSIASVAGMVAEQREISSGSMTFTISGDLSDLEPGSVEIGVKMNVAMPIEEKKDFLDEIDANLRSITHLKKNKLEA